MLNEEGHNMFKWNKKYGCNCCPIPGEKYILLVGDLYMGVVHQKGDSRCLVWAAEYYCNGKFCSGRSGGSYTRNECMDYVEEMISDALVNLFENLRNSPGNREIYDSNNGHKLETVVK